eukprot:2659304-Pleurochrysis_carterae.AAC.2
MQSLELRARYAELLLSLAQIGAKLLLHLSEQVQRLGLLLRDEEATRAEITQASLNSEISRASHARTLPSLQASR